MTKLNEVYKCNICGNIVEVVHASGGELVCCGQAMELLKEKSVDLGNEKHVPVITVKGSKVIVQVGSIMHPMEEKHFIGWIEILSGNKAVARAMLKPGQKPIAEFCLEDTKGITAREYCNLHGLWKSK